MSEQVVKRYDISGFGGGMVESADGAWYHMDDYDALQAEAEALRAENAKLRTALAEQGERQEAIGRIGQSHGCIVRFPVWNTEDGSEPPAGTMLYTSPQPGPDVRALVEALEWYERQAAGCRKLTGEGDLCRQALDSDGGKRAQTAIAAHRQTQQGDSNA